MGKGSWPLLHEAIINFEELTMRNLFIRKFLKIYEFILLLRNVEKFIGIYKQNPKLGEGLVEVANVTKLK